MLKNIWFSYIIQQSHPRESLGVFAEDNDEGVILCQRFCEINCLHQFFKLNHSDTSISSCYGFCNLIQTPQLWSWYLHWFRELAQCISLLKRVHCTVLPYIAFTQYIVGGFTMFCHTVKTVCIFVFRLFENEKLTNNYEPSNCGFFCSKLYLLPLIIYVKTSVPYNIWMGLDL